jgi:hypothetical protein
MSNWLDFKNQNPDMEDFFHSKFNSEQEFKEQLIKYEETYYQKLFIRGSYLIKNNDELLEQFKYSQLTLYCKHGGKYFEI